MKYTAIFLLFCMLTAKAVSQPEFSAVKVDDSNFPHIDVWLRADSGTVSEDNLQLFSEDNAPLDYELEKVQSLKHDKESAVIVLFFLSGQKSADEKVLRQLSAYTEELKGNFKINLATVSRKDQQTESDFLSPEFSNKFSFFLNNLDDLALQSDTVVKINPVLMRLSKELAATRNQTVNYSVFLTGETFEFQGNEPLIHDLVHTDIHVYSLLRDSLQADNENNLIALCSRTGGMYTKAATEKFKDILNAYTEDALLYASVSGFEFFKLRFKSSAKAKKNYAILSNGEEELSIVYYRKRLLGETEIYQLLLLLLAILLVYFILKFFAYRRKIYYLKLKNRRKELVPDSDKTVVLNIQGSGFSEKYELSKDRYTIGRHKKNNITVDDETLSAFHAEIFKESGLYTIFDKGSTNGIYADGQRVIKEKLKKDMLLKLGKIYIKISYE